MQRGQESLESLIQCQIGKTVFTFARYFYSSSTKLSLYRPTETEPPESTHGTDLGPLHICNSCTSRSSCGTPNSRRSGCLRLCYMPLDPFPLTLLPCLASIGDVPSSTATLLVKEAWYLRRTEMGGWGSEVRERNWEEGGKLLLGYKANE